jgi:Fe-S-cluster containining protein
MVSTNPCSYCSANCCISYTITATAFDILRISEKTGRKPEEFAVLSQARLLAFDPDTTLDMSDDGWIYLLGIRSHPCILLGKDNNCTVHDCAPMSCRRYPFQLDGKLNTRFCPLAPQLIFRLKGPDIKTGQMVRELDLYKKIVKEWNKKPGKKDECLGFLLNRAKALAQK